jgi:hypothetical protein
MKILISTFIILFSVVQSFGQTTFKVIKVNGDIVLKAKGVSLETGTVFSEKEDLLFRTEDATAAVINSQKGRFILTGKNHDLSTAKSNSLPSMYNISTRGSGALTNLIDLQAHFSGNYVILGKEKIKISSSNFPINDDSFFFIKYAYKGENINKKLDHSGDTLIIDRLKLFTIDGKQIPGPDNTNIALFYKKGADYLLINSFDLIFPDGQKIKKELKVILDEYKSKSPNDKISEITYYINEFYGKVDGENLNKWLAVNFGLKKN